MKRIFTLLSAVALTAVSFGQTVFQSDLSSWSGGTLTDWASTATNATYSEVTTGANYGTSMASIDNQTTSHKRLATNAFTVTPGETYEVTVWGSGVAEVRVAFRDVTGGGSSYSYPNDYVDYDTLSTPSYVQSITLGSSTTDIEVILSVRNTDATGALIDSVSIAVGAPVVYAPHSIYDIQYTTDASGDSELFDSLVTTSGVVTGTYDSGFWIQDAEGAWNGVLVYDYGNNAVVIGDSVTVQAKVTEYYDLTELVDVLDVTVEGTAVVMPAAFDISSLEVADEEYEGVLVKMSTAKCITADNGYGESEMNTNETNLAETALIDTMLTNAYFPLTANSYYDVTGIGHYSFSTRYVLPRMASDVVLVGAASIEENSMDVAVYPNPATENVTISGIENGTVTIYNVNGQNVYNNTLNGTLTVNVDAFEAGFYIIEVVENGNKAHYKLMVK